MSPGRVLLGVLLLSSSIAAAAPRQRVITPPAPAPAPGTPTWSHDVAPIVQEHCQACHRPNEIAPFSLLTYSDAAPWAKRMKLMTQTHQMPPWKPEEGCGEFADKRGLTPAQIETITKWADAGAPRGNPADEPAPKVFSSDWALGQPDLVLSYNEPYTPPSEGDMYRCFPIPTNLTEDRYVAAIDIRPGDRETVHHVIAYTDTTGESEQKDAAEPGPGYTSFGGPGIASFGALGGWAPGARPVTLPDGVALQLAKNSRIVLQIHYHPHDGAPEPDTTQIGIYFAKTKPSKLLRILPLINQDFTIPAGNPAYEVEAVWPILTPIPMHVWVIAPHMHLLGRSMQVEAKLPNGSTECLINIGDWDFHWQGLYRYQEPVALPALTRVSLKAIYDNSASNPLNPNLPPKDVSWGEATTDEMCIAFLGVTFDQENLTP